MISRRGMLTGIFAASAAPAILKADSLMKIFVPSQKIFSGRGLTSSINYVDELAYLSDEEFVREYKNVFISDVNNIAYPTLLNTSFIHIKYDKIDMFDNITCLGSNVLHVTIKQPKIKECIDRNSYVSKT